MADFCNKCAYEMFGEDKRYVDIDVPKLFEELSDNSYFSVICEGCGMAAVGKENGKLIIAYFKTPHDGTIKWKDNVNLNEYKI
jgi:hypothetical protein